MGVLADYSFAESIKIVRDDILSVKKNYLTRMNVLGQDILTIDYEFEFKSFPVKVVFTLDRNNEYYLKCDVYLTPDFINHKAYYGLDWWITNIFIRDVDLENINSNNKDNLVQFQELGFTERAFMIDKKGKKLSYMEYIRKI